MHPEVNSLKWFSGACSDGDRSLLLRKECGNAGKTRLLRKECRADFRRKWFSDAYSEGGRPLLLRKECGNDGETRLLRKECRVDFRRKWLFSACSEGGRPLLLREECGNDGKTRLLRKECRADLRRKVDSVETTRRCRLNVFFVGTFRYSQLNSSALSAAVSNRVDCRSCRNRLIKYTKCGTACRCTLITC